MRPSEALEMQAGMLQAARKSDAVARYDVTSSWMGVPARVIAESECVGLSTAETFLVTADMARLALHASETMPREELLASDLPASAGFVVLETPIPFATTSGAVHPGRCFRWRLYTRSDGDQRVVCHWYADGHHAPMAQWVRTIGFKPHSIQRLAEMNGTDPVAQGRQVMVSEVFVMALWALMRQVVRRTRAERPDRATRRRLAKELSPLKDNMVKVVTLRRIDADHGREVEHGTVEWSHRWIVSGHWRNQWCPKLGVHRQTWISPYVKGDEDKPLIIKPTVSVLAR